MNHHPPLPTIPRIRSILERLFPEGLEMRATLMRDMTARTVYVLLYGFARKSNGRRLRPAHIYFFTEDQSKKTTPDEREAWYLASNRPGFRPEGERWYADTTKEPIRDETLRYGLIAIGAVSKLEGLPTTTPLPIYYLHDDFADLFDVTLKDDQLTEAISRWQATHLSAAARARMTLLSAGKAKSTTDVLVKYPDGTVSRLGAGPSSIITKAVVEEFAPRFLRSPAVLWLSESGNKVRHQDDTLARAIGLKIDQAKVLPDIILVHLGATGNDVSLIFVEVVATDGPISQQRKDALLAYIRESGFPEEQCFFVTAFEDRNSSAFKKAWPTLAWGTHVWFRAEPDRLLDLEEAPYDVTVRRPRP